MTTLRMFQVDAFTGRVFTGNPAAVVPLQSWLDDSTMQSIAMENALSETAFFVPEGDGYRLRWFTPLAEVRLCGHATLASAFVVFSELGHPTDTVKFETLSGTLAVRRDGDRLVMDFPARPVERCADMPALLVEALGVEPVEVWSAGPTGRVLAVYEDEATVRAIQPNFTLLTEMHRGVAPTAPGDSSDCASRFFLPDHGIPEDPVTGSIHCSLVPYWSQRLGKQQIHARQVSRRGGELFCEDCGDRILIAGQAVKFMDATIRL